MSSKREIFMIFFCVPFFFIYLFLAWNETDFQKFVLWVLCAIFAFFGVVGATADISSKQMEPEKWVC